MPAASSVTVDGNEAVASVAYRASEVIAIYPITPSSPMGESADSWASERRPNAWGTVPDVVEMQSEGGAAGAVHGSLQVGSLTTTFTASQGLLLMIPNMYKIAGELTSCCIHVSARTVATHALSIFCDHSDVMACRQTGFALLASGSVQEAQDLACIGHAATLDSRVPFLHFFDGFRTSHEIARIEELSDANIRAMVRDELIELHRARALSPEQPVIRGTAQNPDTFFQAREACNRYYDACASVVRGVMERFGALTGRAYDLFDYVGHPEAERVVVLMGSAAETAHETVERLVERGERVGVVKVRLYRPFSIEGLVRALPATVRAISVLDRTKEPGAVGEPLYVDVVTALREARDRGLSRFSEEPRIVGGRYGLSSKEFTPAMVKVVLDDLKRAEPRNHFTVGIVDDVTHTSLPAGEEIDTGDEDVFGAIFFGLGSDGTVSANKSSIKIIGEETPNHAQGYFVYDSKKAGAVTISHLRFGPRPIRSTYLVRGARFVACHQFNFLEKLDVLEDAAPGAVFLLNSPYGPDAVWDHLPLEVQESIVEKQIELWVIDAYRVARETGMGGRINTIMQTCFFTISGVLPRDEAISRIKAAISKAYGRKGEEIVRRNCAAVDSTVDHLHRVTVPDAVTTDRRRPPIVPEDAPSFVKRVTALMLSGKGDLLPVSAFPPDGTWPTGTTRWERRGVAHEIPLWDPSICIQCNKCAFVCPHAAIRARVYDPVHVSRAPAEFLSAKSAIPEFEGFAYTIQVAPDDCTGCRACVVVCPAKDKSNPRHKAIDMKLREPVLARERDNYRFFLDLPAVDRSAVKPDVRGTQLLDPLFEYSGACAGCGETPYVKLLTQLFGDRALIANATGCSSIYGGNLPTTPYATDADGRGPAWSNSLFEDNAEFGLGFRLAVDKHRDTLAAVLTRNATALGEELVRRLLEAKQSTEREIAEQRRRVASLITRLDRLDETDARTVGALADFLVRRSVWLVGGDGWAYDIGFGGLDHVLSMRRDVNILVLDTEVYSNTGGQQSKATPLGAAAKFAIDGKEVGKKDLGLIAMSYGHVYVGNVAYGARDSQTVQVFREAESYPGPSLIIAYSHCIAHGYDMAQGPAQQKLAVDSGIWPLYRFDPRNVAAGAPPLKLESRRRTSAREYLMNEARFRMVEKQDPKRFRRLLEKAQRLAEQRFAVYQQLAGVTVPVGGDGDGRENDAK